MVKVGFSTSVVGGGYEIDGIWDLDPQVIEICDYSPITWPLLRRALAPHDIPLAFHCPTPYFWKGHFEITGPNPQRRKEALQITENILQIASQTAAEYVVVHFPSVFATPHLPEIGESAHNAMALESAFVLSELSKREGIPILLENVGPNPHFYRGEQYKSILDQLSDLGLCFDFGHAHVLEIEEDVYSFAEKVCFSTRSIHLYNTSRDSYAVGRHMPPLSNQLPQDGWMDLPQLFEIMSKSSSLKYVIFEYSLIDIERSEILDGIKWTREWLAHFLELEDE